MADEKKKWSDVKALLDDPSVPAGQKSALISSWLRENPPPPPFLADQEPDEIKQKRQEAEKYANAYNANPLFAGQSVDEAFDKAKQSGDQNSYNEDQEKKAVDDGKSKLDGTQPPASGDDGSTSGTKTSDEIFDAAAPALKLFETFGSLLAKIPADCRGNTRALDLDKDIRAPFDEQRGISFADFVADAAHFKRGSETVDRTVQDTGSQLGTLYQTWSGAGADAASDTYNDKIQPKAAKLSQTLGNASEATKNTATTVFQLCKGKADAVIGMYTDLVGKADYTMAQKVVAVASGEHGNEQDLAQIAGWMDLNFGTNLVKTLNDQGCCDGDEIKKHGQDLAKQWIQNQFNPDMWDRLYKGFEKTCKDTKDLVDQAYDALDKVMGGIKNEFEGVSMPGGSGSGAPGGSGTAGGSGGGPGGSGSGSGSGSGGSGGGSGSGSGGSGDGSGSGSGGSGSGSGSGSGGSGSGGGGGPVPSIPDTGSGSGTPGAGAGGGSGTDLPSGADGSGSGSGSGGGSGSGSGAGGGGPIPSIPDGSAGGGGSVGGGSGSSGGSGSGGGDDGAAQAEAAKQQAAQAAEEAKQKASDALKEFSGPGIQTDSGEGAGGLGGGSGSGSGPGGGSGSGSGSGSDDTSPSSTPSPSASGQDAAAAAAEAAKKKAADALSEFSGPGIQTDDGAGGLGGGSGSGGGGDSGSGSGDDGKAAAEQAAEDAKNKAADALKGLDGDPIKTEPGDTGLDTDGDGKPDSLLGDGKDVDKDGDGKPDAKGDDDPDVLKVKQGDKTFEMTEPDHDGKMDIKVGDGPGDPKDFKLDWSGDGKSGDGPQGTDDDCYRPGPDGKIHIRDGDLKITAERPDGADGPTVVTVDDGTGKPTTYTLGEDGKPSDALGDTPSKKLDDDLPTHRGTLEDLKPHDGGDTGGGAHGGGGSPSPAGIGGGSHGGAGVTGAGFDPGGAGLGDSPVSGGAHTGAGAAQPQPAGAFAPAAAGATGAAGSSMAGMPGMGAMGGHGAGGGDTERKSPAYRIEGAVFDNLGEPGRRIIGSLHDDEDPPSARRTW
ncbi:WXG100 family type VII secretion target [Amycolatopsis sp. cg9]|uniref:WXG100 family type VII secretion target n=1 Tax=Amycolatopsis sp. cg9 TaxID=3238801 RepID=UPI0035234C72